MTTSPMRLDLNEGELRSRANFALRELVNGLNQYGRARTVLEEDTLHANAMRALLLGYPTTVTVPFDIFWNCCITLKHKWALEKSMPRKVSNKEMRTELVTFVTPAIEVLCSRYGVAADFPKSNEYHFKTKAELLCGLKGSRLIPKYLQTESTISYEELSRRFRIAIRARNVRIRNKCTGNARWITRDDCRSWVHVTAADECSNFSVVDVELTGGNKIPQASPPSGIQYKDTDCDSDRFSDDDCSSPSLDYHTPPFTHPVRNESNISPEDKELNAHSHPKIVTATAASQITGNDLNSERYSDYDSTITNKIDSSLEESELPAKDKRVCPKRKYIPTNHEIGVLFSSGTFVHYLRNKLEMGKADQLMQQIGKYKKIVNQVFQDYHDEMSMDQPIDVEVPSDVKLASFGGCHSSSPSAPDVYGIYDLLSPAMRNIVRRHIFYEMEYVPYKDNYGRAISLQTRNDAGKGHEAYVFFSTGGNGAKTWAIRGRKARNSVVVFLFALNDWLKDLLSDFI